jgi:hypothetical protein
MGLLHERRDILPHPYWPSSSELSAFKDLYIALPSSDVKKLGKIKTKKWFSAANKVVALCRSITAENYHVPSLFPGTGKLPGYYSGYTKLEDDPSCDAPTCENEFFTSAGEL